MNKHETDLAILSLLYSNYTSRAHTIFSCLLELTIAVSLGFFGMVFSYYQLFQIKPDKYKILLFLIISLFLIGLSIVIACYLISESRIKRKKIIQEINKLNLT